MGMESFLQVARLQQSLSDYKPDLVTPDHCVDVCKLLESESSLQPSLQTTGPGIWKLGLPFLRSLVTAEA